MPEIKILTERELRAAVALDLEAVDCVEKAFAALASGKVSMPPILSMAIPDYHGEVDVKTAYVPGVDSFAIKISPGFFDNPKLGLPSTSGLMVLFSAKTGMVEAVLLDNGYLTDIRTAAAGAVAARHLSRQESSRACIIGAGMQSRLQLQALCLVRPITHASIWARDAAKAEVVASEMSEKLGIEVVATGDAAAAVGEADIVVTTTPSTSSVLMAEWLRPGQHITAMGSDQDNKNELDPACLSRADLYVPDRRAQTETLGELRSAIAAGTVSADAQFRELGEVILDEQVNRPPAADRSPVAITIADLTGTGVQDTAIAAFARSRALAQGAGTDIVN